MFNRIVRHGIDIRRHPFKGVYVCTIGKNQKHTSQAEVICTLREGRDIDEATNQSEPEYGPITLSYRGLQATLRPWTPHQCVIAAGIHNGLIHFPIRPGTRIFALGCSLQTLSHLADTVRESGRLIGVISENHPERPTQEQLAQFFKRHPRVPVIIEDVHNATLEKYELRLSLPLSSRHAFLMAMHPRLGADSPARLLAADTQKLVEHIFSFLICVDAAKVKCLVVCHWPPETKVETVREVVLTHIDILQRWRAPRVEKQGRGVVTFAENTGMANDNTNDDDDEEQDQEQDQDDQEGDGTGDGMGSSDAQGMKTDQQDGVREKKRSKKDKAEAVLQWVLLDLPTDRIITEKTPHDFNSKLTEVVESIKRLKSGLRTGLLAKELLRLTPYFHNDVLLLMKYVAHHDQRTRKCTRKKNLQPAVPDDEGEEVEGVLVGETPPSSSSMPMPSFLGGGGAKSLALPAPGGASPSQAIVAPAPGLTLGLNIMDELGGPRGGDWDSVAASSGNFSGFPSGVPAAPPPGLTQPYGHGAGPGGPFPSSGQFPMSPPPLPGNGMGGPMNRKGMSGKQQSAMQNAAPGGRPAPGMEDSERWPYRDHLGAAPGSSATDFGPGIWGPPGPPPRGGGGFHSALANRMGGGGQQQWNQGAQLQMAYPRGPQQKGIGKGAFQQQNLPKRGSGGAPGPDQQFPFMGGGGPGLPPGAPPGLPPDQTQYMAMSF